MRKSGSLFPYSAGGEFGSLGGRSFCKILESGEAETSQSHAGGVCVGGGIQRQRCWSRRSPSRSWRLWPEGLILQLPRWPARAQQQHSWSSPRMKYVVGILLHSYEPLRCEVPLPSGFAGREDGPCFSFRFLMSPLFHALCSFFILNVLLLA